MAAQGSKDKLRKQRGLLKDGVNLVRRIHYTKSEVLLVASVNPGHKYRMASALTESSVDLHRVLWLPERLLWL